MNPRDRRLRLHKNTVRNLSAPDAGRAQGGTGGTVDLDTKDPSMRADCTVYCGGNSGELSCKSCNVSCGGTCDLACQYETYIDPCETFTCPRQTLCDTFCLC